MGLSDIKTLLDQAVDALENAHLTVQQGLCFASTCFTFLRIDYAKELSGENSDIYSAEISDLYLEVNSVLQDIEIDDSIDPPAVVINVVEAQWLKEKIIRLNSLIKEKAIVADSLDDLYYQ